MNNRPIRLNISYYKQMIKAQNVCFDLETTSLSIHDAEIVEIAAIAFNFDGRTRIGPCVVDTFQSLVKPVFNNPNAVKIHGITDFMLRDAKPFDQILPEFLKWIGESTTDDFIWIGHNIRKYDLPILNRHANYHGNLHRSVFDTLEVARKVYKGRKKTLASLYTMLEGENNDLTAHRALSDVKMNIVVACDELMKLSLL